MFLMSGKIQYLIEIEKLCVGKKMALLVLRRVGLCIGQNQMCHLCGWLKLFLKNVRWEKIKKQKRWILGRLSDGSFVQSLVYVLFCRSFLLCRLLGLQVTSLLANKKCDKHSKLARLANLCFVLFFKYITSTIIYNVSKGLIICCNPSELTWVYIWVVFGLLCPSISCMYRRLVPASSKCVA
jgi:hypothetical protein